MNILAVASEAYPLVKTGGLADVVGALPAALAGEGVNVRTLLPGYPAVLKAIGRKKPAHVIPDLFGGKALLVGANAGGLDLLVLDAPHLYDRPGGLYGDAAGVDWPDNWRRFAALGKAAALVAEGAVKGWRPDLVHAHDWQAALAPAYLRHGPAAGTPSVVTVHNLAFQGQFAATIFPTLGLPDSAMQVDGVEYYGGVGFLKAGLQYADAVTTVSPGYAEEIRTPPFGMGLDGLVNLRAGDLHGIVNGIDVGIWNPGDDPHLAVSYSAKALKSRAANKRAVEQRFGIEPGDGPLLCVVSRLTWQKGIDLLAQILDRIAWQGARLAVLGNGDSALEGAMLAGAARHRGRIGVVVGYDEGLSHLMQGGCDAILVPSRFEPCGLTQLYGLRYGCVPVVARTGGLGDTVVDANEAAIAAGVGTGFLFEPGSADALARAVERVTRIWADPTAWASLQKQGMRTDVSWTRSAKKYADLYRMLVKRGQS